jgi:hypothetical protein
MHDGTCLFQYLGDEEGGSQDPVSKKTKTTGWGHGSSDTVHA